MKFSINLAFLPAMMLVIGLTTCIQKAQAGKDYSVKPYCESPEPLAWTRHYGRSRVFNVQFGHDKEGFASPQFRELIVRGIRWTAGVRQSSNFSALNTGMKSTSTEGETVQSTSSETVLAVSINDIQKGLVAYWPLDNLSTTTPDLSGNRNHLQAMNLTAADVVSGKIGNAISFNGINSLLLCFAAKGSGLPACSHPASTVAMWVKGSTANETGRVFSETTNARNPLVAISTDRRAPEGVVDLYMRADNGNTLVSHHRTSLVAFDNAWHHIAWVDDHGEIRLYVDGIQDTSRINYNREPITPTITALGGVMRFDTVRFAFQGLIDETAIWSRALTDTEIRLVMKKGLANFLPKTNSQSQNQIVVAKEQLNSATSSETVKDADGNIYHTVKIGTQVWTVENLKTTKFNDGTQIPNVIEAEEWKSLNAPGYCCYENNPEN
jgi:hypothetical protein